MYAILLHLESPITEYSVLTGYYENKDEVEDFLTTLYTGGVWIYELDTQNSIVVHNSRIEYCKIIPDVDVVQTPYVLKAIQS